MRVSSRKAKGRKLQNTVASLLRNKYREVLEAEDIRPALMGESGVDIKLSPQAKKIIPWDVECKNQEKWNVEEWWKQTVNNTCEGRKPLLVIKKNRHEELVVLRLSDWEGYI